MGVIPIIVRRRKKIVEKFISTQTLNIGSAKSLEELDLKDNRDIKFLLVKGTIVKTEDGSYYLDERKKFFK